jgi:hypothetical protein
MPLLQGNMAFRFIFIAAMAVLTLNISVVFNVEKANPVEKAFMLAAAVAILMRGKIDRTLVAPALLIFLATLVSALFTGYPHFSWDTYARQLVNLASLLVFLVTIPLTKDRDDLFRVLAFIPLAQVAVGICYAALGLQPLFYMDSSIGVPRLAGATIPAFLAGFAVVGGLAALFYADIKDKPRYLWLVALNGFILLLTAARMATLVAIITWGAAFIFGFRRQYRLKFYLAIAGVVLAPVMLALFGEQLVARALSFDEKSRDVMRYFLEHYAEAYPDFGIGLGHQYTIISRDLIVRIGAVAAHNEYLKYLVELGWVGGGLFALGWAWLFVATWGSRINTRRTVYLLCVVAFLIYSATDNTLVRNELSFLIVVAAYGARLALAARAASRKPDKLAHRRAAARQRFAQPLAAEPANQA